MGWSRFPRVLAQVPSEQEEVNFFLLMSFAKDFFNSLKGVCDVEIFCFN
jgi:hypothetical protein